LCFSHRWFAFVFQGKAKAMKPMQDQKDSSKSVEMEVLNYSAGSYFGEVALLNSQPRAASVFGPSLSCLFLSPCS
jgi:hypothetical protein